MKPRTLEIHRPVIEHAILKNRRGGHEHFVHLPTQTVVMWNQTTKSFTPQRCSYKPKELIALPAAEDGADPEALARIVDDWEASLTREFGATDFNHQFIVPLDAVSLPPFDPPKAILDEAEYRQALRERRKLRLIVADNDNHPFYKRFKQLGQVIKAYEEKHYPILHAFKHQEAC